MHIFILDPTVGFLLERAVTDFPGRKLSEVKLGRTPDSWITWCDGYSPGNERILAAITLEHIKQAAEQTGIGTQARLLYSSLERKIIVKSRTEQAYSIKGL